MSPEWLAEAIVHGTGMDDDKAADIVAKFTIEVRRQAIVDFIDRQSVVYRKHSGLAITEDMTLAVIEFGVEPHVFYTDDEGETDVESTQWLEAQVMHAQADRHERGVE